MRSDETVLRAWLAYLAAAECGHKVAIADMATNPNRLGQARWDGSQYVIELDPDLRGTELLRVWTHECAHVVLGHVPRCTLIVKSVGGTDSRAGMFAARVAANVLEQREIAAEDWARGWWARQDTNVKAVTGLLAGVFEADND